MTMAIQRGNVSSRAEYYVFRKFSVRDMQQFDVMTVVGNCATMATLNEAKVQQAEVLIAATSRSEERRVGKECRR